jgi:hypothetical protein
MAKRGRKPQDPKLKQEIVSGSFSKVISMVESGETICNTLNKLCIDRGMFYRFITEQQKVELQMAKTLNTKYGVGSTFTTFSRSRNKLSNQ